MWKGRLQTYWHHDPFTAVAKTGIQLKLVDSIVGPGKWLRNALWHTGHTTDHVKLLWDDPKQEGWQRKVTRLLKPNEIFEICQVAYRWVLIHRPMIGLIRLRWG